MLLKTFSEYLTSAERQAFLLLHPWCEGCAQASVYNCRACAKSSKTHFCKTLKEGFEKMAVAHMHKENFNAQ